MPAIRLQLSDITIAVLGLGYVGLPLASAFGSLFRTTGFDTHSGRIRIFTLDTALNKSIQAISPAV